jgi:3-oxoadipate enol-lactonase
MTYKAILNDNKRDGTVTTSDGITLPYTVYGNDSTTRPRLVLIHSLAMSRLLWKPVAERLASRATILTLDCRGHGDATKASGPYRLEDFASDLAQLMDHLGWAKAYVAGASMGGSVALQFAVSYPSRVLGLGLIDTTAWYGAEAKQRWEWRAHEAEEKGLGALIDFQQTRWFTDKYREQNTEEGARCRSIFLAGAVSSFAATCRMLGDFDLRSKLSGLEMPTAVVVGDEDYATPPDMARVLQSGIPGATLQVIPAARHLTFVERPDVVADALSELLDRPSPFLTSSLP